MEHLLNEYDAENGFIIQVYAHDNEVLNKEAATKILVKYEKSILKLVDDALKKALLQMEISDLNGCSVEINECNQNFKVHMHDNEHQDLSILIDIDGKAVFQYRLFNGISEYEYRVTEFIEEFDSSRVNNGYGFMITKYLDVRLYDILLEIIENSKLNHNSFKVEAHDYFWENPIESYSVTLNANHMLIEAISYYGDYEYVYLHSFVSAPEPIVAVINRYILARKFRYGF